MPIPLGTAKDERHVVLVVRLSRPWQIDVTLPSAGRIDEVNNVLPLLTIALSAGDNREMERHLISFQRCLGFCNRSACPLPNPTLISGLANPGVADTIARSRSEPEFINQFGVCNLRYPPRPADRYLVRGGAREQRQGGKRKQSNANDVHVSSILLPARKRNGPTQKPDQPTYA